MAKSRDRCGCGPRARGHSWFSVYQVNKGVVTVQTGKVVKEDLTSIVTASGEFRPRNYTNVEGKGIGKITQIVVKKANT